MAWTPKVVRTVVDGDVQVLAVGHPLVDEYLAFLGARVRLNSWLAAAYDLKVFFSVIPNEQPKSARLTCSPSSPSNDGPGEAPR